MIFCYTKGEIIKEVADSEYVPRVEDHVSFDGKKEFIVTMVFYDYESRKLLVKVRPARSSDVTFLG